MKELFLVAMLGMAVGFGVTIGQMALDLAVYYLTGHEVGTKFGA